MTIKLNDQYHEVQEGTSLDVFIESLGIKSNGVAVAINFEVVPKEKWAETTLSDHQELILIHAVSGG